MVFFTWWETWTELELVCIAERIPLYLVFCFRGRAERIPTRTIKN